MPTNAATINKKIARREKIRHELKEYIINVIYLTLFFGAFAWYQRLILAQYDIDYFHYGAAFIEALILGKVIMIGDFLKLGQRFHDRPLIIPVLYKTLVFTLFVGIFTILEYIVRGIFGGKGITGGFGNWINRDILETLAQNLVTFCVFIPFFAFKEMDRVVGVNKIHKLFFDRSSIMSDKK